MSEEVSCLRRDHSVLLTMNNGIWEMERNIAFSSLALAEILIVLVFCVINYNVAFSALAFNQLYVLLRSLIFTSKKYIIAYLNTA